MRLTIAKVAMPLARMPFGRNGLSKDTIGPVVGKNAFPFSTVTRRPQKSSATNSQADTFVPSQPLQAGSGKGGRGKCRPRSYFETLPRTDTRVLRSVDAMRAWRRPHVTSERQIALVPTMGALHAGHDALIRAAARENHHVVVSLFVNPSQFGEREDLASYPRTWEADVARLRRLNAELAGEGGHMATGISAVFAPTVDELYPSGFPGQRPDSPGSWVDITPLSSRLEGSVRPTFFRGVATVCMKLFQAVQPARVYFGQKDVQQTVVIRTMVRDFLMPLDVVVVPTVREAEAQGLALSSRNVYLGERRKRVAPCLYRALQAGERVYRGALGREQMHAAQSRAEVPEEEGSLTQSVSARAILDASYAVLEATLAAQKALPASERALFTIEYVSLTDPDTMAPLAPTLPEGDSTDVPAGEPEPVSAGRVDPSRGAILSAAIRMHEVEEARDGEDLGYQKGPPVRLLDNVILRPWKEYGDGKGIDYE